MTEEQWFAYTEAGSRGHHRPRRFRLFHAVTLNPVGWAALFGASLPLATLLVFVAHQSWWLSLAASIALTLIAAIMLDRRKMALLVHSNDCPAATPAANNGTPHSSAPPLHYRTRRWNHSLPLRRDGSRPFNLDAEIERLRFIGLVKDLPSGRLITTAAGDDVIDATGKWEVVVSELTTNRWSGDRTIVIAESIFKEPDAGDRFVSSRGTTGTVVGHDFVTSKEGRLGLFLDVEVSPGDTLTALPTAHKT